MTTLAFSSFPKLSQWAIQTMMKSKSNSYSAGQKHYVHAFTHTYFYYFSFVHMVILSGGMAERHHIQKKDLYRREDNGRRCFLGDIISSIPGHYSYFAQGRVEEQADLRPILQLVLVLISLFYSIQLQNRLICTLFFSSSWCKSAYSSIRPGANQPIIQLALVQISLFFNSSWGKIAIALSNGRNSDPQEAARTFAFSSV